MSSVTENYFTRKISDIELVPALCRELLICWPQIQNRRLNMNNYIFQLIDLARFSREQGWQTLSDELKFLVEIAFYYLPKH